MAHVMKTAIELSMVGQPEFDEFVEIRYLVQENGSGRYPVTKLWHKKQNRELRIDEALEKYMRKFHNFFEKWQKASGLISKVLKKKDRLIESVETR